MLKPPKLQPGDKVATISLSWGGPGAFPHRYLAGKMQLQAEFGLDVVEMPHTLCDPDWVRRHPQARADDLMAAFSDPAIKGIISTIGGDDSIRILPYLNLDLIRANPKILLGYSDTTVTHPPGLLQSRAGVLLRAGDDGRLCRERRLVPLSGRVRATHPLLNRTTGDDCP